MTLFTLLEAGRLKPSVPHPPTSCLSQAVMGRMVVCPEGTQFEGRETVNQINEPYYNGTSLSTRH